MPTNPAPAGQRVPCSRCGTPCVIRTGGNEYARLLRLAKKPAGPAGALCVNCGFHSFLIASGLADIIRIDANPGALRLPHIQQQIQGLMKIGKADASFEEINFETVIANWELPFKGKR